MQTLLHMVYLIFFIMKNFTFGLHFEFSIVISFYVFNVILFLVHSI